MRTTQNERGQGGEAAVNTAVERRKIVIALGLALGALFLVLFARGTGPQAAQAASHREAPLIALDPTADITDFFMFRDYEPGQQDKVALIMDVIPGEEPSSGPNYWNFDPNVLYKFSVDNNGDGQADDVQLEFRFRTEPIRGIARQFTLPFSYVGGAGGLPPITALDGPGSEGLGLRQRYTEVGQWFAEHRLISDAVDHALAADDEERAIELVESDGTYLLEQSQMTTLLGLVGKLPPNLVEARPRLQLAVAWANILVHRPVPANCNLSKSCGLKQRIRWRIPEQ